MGLFWNRKPPPAPPIWEYKIHNLEGHGLSFHVLSVLGKVGWELVCVAGQYLIFKRPLPENERKTDQWLSEQWEKDEEKRRETEERFIREMEADDGDT